MATIQYEVPNNVQRMTIGVQGENNVREFLFDVTEWRQITGNIGAAEMVVQRNGDASPYAAAITMHDENTVSWVPTSTDTGKVGAGKLQLMWIAGGQTIKTKIFDMKVDQSLEYAVPDTSLDPWASWMPGIINADANYKGLTSRVDDLQQRQTSPYNFKGSAADLASLPSSGNEVNDTYYVEAVKYRVTWTGEDWQQSSMDEGDYEDELAKTNNTLDDIITTGINLFDPQKAKINIRINSTTGAEEAANAFYCSDFIPVLPDTEYYIAVALGSKQFLTCAFYDSNKGFLSGTYKNPVTSYVETTPDNCAYIRINGAKVAIDQQCIRLKNSTGSAATEPFEYIVNGKSRDVTILSLNNIFYNAATGLLSSKSDIYVLFSKQVYNFGRSIDVGAGSYLYYNKASKSLTAESSLLSDKDSYFLGHLANKRLDPANKQATLACAFPIFSLDYTFEESDGSIVETKTFTVDVAMQPAYLFYSGSYYTIPKNYHKELTLNNELCYIYYAPDDGEFYVSNSYTFTEINRGILIAFINFRHIWCISDYTTPVYDDTLLRIDCYGDSLTWYNKQIITWGPDQGEVCVGYEQYLLNELNCREVKNHGYDGNSTPQICAHILENASSIAGSEVVTIMGGNNDDRLSIPAGELLPVGSTFDTTTVTGALQSAVEFILATNPSVRIILMTEPMGWTYRNGAMQRVSESIPEAYRKVAEYYGLPLIDLWAESGFNELNRDIFYLDPPVEDNHYYIYHPNNEGWGRLSKLIVKRIKELM